MQRFPPFSYLSFPSLRFRCNDTHVARGDVNYQEYLRLSGLYDRIEVEGDLDLPVCVDLISLPENLRVGGDLYLSGCTGLTSLPENLSVGGWLNLFHCTGLTSLAENLSVGGDLYLSGCTGLTSLAENLSVGGNLDLSGCTGLTSLPEHLSVGGDLNLSGCTGLTSLPENLSVGRDLNLRHCTGVTGLPENLIVGGNLDLSGCTGLTSLPNDIVSWGRASNSSFNRNIYLEGSGISREILERLGDSPGMQFHFSMASGVTNIDEFPNLKTAVDCWYKLVPDSSKKSPNVEEWKLDSENSNNLNFFLSKLKGTKDYTNANTRPLLAKRVIQTLDIMNSDKAVRDKCLERIYEGTITCGDRTILMMNQMEILIRVVQAKRIGKDDLKKLALGLCRLEVLHRHAAQKSSTLRFVDEIEVYLAYEVKLAKQLQLPVSTQDMLYFGCASVTDEDLGKALSEASAINEKADAFLQYLDDWEPWQQHLRQQAVLPWQNIKQEDVTIDPEDLCPITQTCFFGLEKPVFLGNAFFDYDSFVTWWVEHGTNPLNSRRVKFTELTRPEEDL